MSSILVLWTEQVISVHGPLVLGSDALVRRNFSKIKPMVIAILCLFRPTPATRNAYLVSSSWKVYFLPRLPHEIMFVLRQHEQTLCCCSFWTHCRQCYGHIHDVGGSRCLRSYLLFPLTCCVVLHRGGLGGGGQDDQDACVLVSFSSHVLRCLAQGGFWGGGGKMLAFWSLLSSPVLRSISLLFPVYVCMLISLL